MTAGSIVLPLPPGEGRGEGRSQARPISRLLSPSLDAAIRPLLLVLLAILCLAPLAVMLSVSLKTAADVQSPGFTFLVMPTLDNYREVLSEDRFGRYLGNSLVVSLVSTGITLGFGTLAAYGLARFRFRGRGAIALSTLMLRTLPPAVLAVPVYVLWSRAGIADTLGGLVLSYVALNLPFTIWLLHGFIQQVPAELEEAAAIDGCTPFDAFWRVVLPVLRPGLAAAAIFTFRIAWNEFILSLILTNRFTRTLPVAASLYITDVGVQWGKLMAAGTLIALPPLVFTFFAARHIIAGMTAGAVKG